MPLLKSIANIKWGLQPEPVSSSKQSIYWWLLWGFQLDVIPTWHLQPLSCREMPLFYTHLAFCGLEWATHFCWSWDRSHCGPLFVSHIVTLCQTSGLLFCCPISSPILEGQKRAGVWPSKSHSPSCCALTAWHRDNEEEVEEATAQGNRSGLWWRRGICETELISPSRELCVSTTPSQAPGAPVGTRLWRSGCETTAA